MKITYEQAIKRLEEIVDMLQEGSLPLDKSLELYEEGAKLSKLCHDMLSQAKQKIIDLNEAKNND